MLNNSLPFENPDICPSPLTIPSSHARGWPNIPECKVSKCPKNACFDRRIHLGVDVDKWVITWLIETSRLTVGGDTNPVKRDSIRCLMPIGVICEAFLANVRQVRGSWDTFLYLTPLYFEQHAGYPHNCVGIFSPTTQRQVEQTKFNHR